jgi:outer membrane protein OmpA-like peptidoglycan-associated protein
MTNMKSRHSAVSVIFPLALLALACTGPMGPRGKTGPAGMTGAQGPAGMTGSPGEDGVTAPPQTYASGWISLRDISFNSGSAVIRPSEANKISEVSAYVDQNPSIHVGIAGSTDLVRGTDRYDVDLSRQRVAAVRDALIRSGVSADRIETGAGVEGVSCNDAKAQCPRREGRAELMARSN